jgi:indole-3-glycerol phosphate synthase
MTMLATILATTRERVAALPPLAELKARAADSPPVRSLPKALTADGMAVIAEVKRRSPSRGDLAPDLDPVERATAYAGGGAAAISVLTEPLHFGGSDEDLASVRGAVDVPVLRKDFTLVPAQIWEARSIGADAVLLIVAALDDQALATLCETAAEVGVGAIVEVHDAVEAERALEAGATIVGVNNRDLTSFDVDLRTAERLAPLLAAAPVTIAESGIHVPGDAARMAAAGYDAVLVGERLVRSDDPGSLIAGFRAGR